MMALPSLSLVMDLRASFPLLATCHDTTAAFVSHPPYIGPSWYMNTPIASATLWSNRKERIYGRSPALQWSCESEAQDRLQVSDCGRWGVGWDRIGQDYPSSGIFKYATHHLISGIPPLYRGSSLWPSHMWLLASLRCHSMNFQEIYDNSMRRQCVHKWRDGAPSRNYFPVYFSDFVLLSYSLCKK